MTVADVSRALAVPVPTLRSWERRYGLPAPPRTAGGHRRYTSRDLATLRELRDEIARGRPPREAARRVAVRGDGDGPDVLALIAAARALDPLAIRRLLD